MMMAYFIKNEKQNFSSDIMAARNTDQFSLEKMNWEQSTCMALSANPILRSPILLECIQWKARPIEACLKPFLIQMT